MLPLRRTARWRIGPRSSATIVAWKPGGSVSPSGCSAAAKASPSAAASTTPSLFIGSSPVSCRFYTKETAAAVVLHGRQRVRRLQIDDLAALQHRARLVNAHRSRGDVLVF